jgi:predicted transcriptional regulator
MTTDRERHEIAAAELAVLRVLWEGAPATVREVMNRLHQRGKRVAYTTVLTFLTRLEQKGFVRSDRSDVAYVYRPLVTREQIRRSRLRTLVDQLYDGSVAPLVLQLIQHERFSRTEIEELHRLIETLDTRVKRPSRR